MDYRFGESEVVHLADNTDSASVSAINRRITRRGVVGIVQRNSRYLVIRRSDKVIAPLLYALPGGGIEPGETQQEALIREFTEELGQPCQPIERVLESITPWGVYLAWWTASMSDEQIANITPSPREVAEVVWLTPEEISQSTQMLASMRLFERWLQEQ